MKIEIIRKLQNQLQFIWSLTNLLSCFIILVLFFNHNSFSQSVGIGSSAFTPDHSAILDVSSTTQGALMPRMTTVQRDAISSPAEGLLIFNITTKCFESYVNGSWNTVSCPATCTPPAAPLTGTHTTSQTQIVWNWNTVSGATGYKWGTADVYSAATDNGASTTKTQTGFTCGTVHSLYVWSYNACGYSTATALTQTTSSCCIAGTVSDGTLTKTTVCEDNHTVIKWAYSSSPGTTTWSVPSGINSVDVLVVAGGGGGGGVCGDGGGGGGAGGLRFVHNAEVSGSVSIIVGNGGIGGIAGSTNNGENGNNSSFGSITPIIATGGGGGGRNDNGRTGGSGGGGWRTKTGGAGNSGSYTPVEGYNGGNGAASGYRGGGGGGAGQEGYTGDNATYPMQGGDGLSQITVGGTIYNFTTLYGTIAGEIINNTAWFAGGGAGANEWAYQSHASGGKGGGGSTSATAGTGQSGISGTGGGGGAGNFGNSYPGGAGGSGIVIISYTTP